MASTIASLPAVVALILKLALIARSPSIVIDKVLPIRWLVCSKFKKTFFGSIEPLAKITRVNPRLRALDEWLEYFGIECAVRHQAAADTFATAELLMRLWPYLTREANSWGSLRDIARQANWLGHS
jgi:hypothetical protein